MRRSRISSSTSVSPAAPTSSAMQRSRKASHRPSSCSPRRWPLSAEMRAAGVACVTAPDIVRGRCDLEDLVALLANLQARQISVDAGCTETIMIREGFLTEARPRTSPSSRTAS